MSYQHNVRPGDWVCGNCQCNNFASRKECFRCKITKGDKTSTQSHGMHSRGENSNTRGSRSLHDLSSSNRPHERGQSSGGSGPRKKREHPIGYKALEKLLELPTEQIVMQLQMEKSGYDLLLENPDDITFDKMCLLMQVLARAVEARLQRENLNIVFTKTFKSKFVNHLLAFSLSICIERKDPHKINEYFCNLWSVLDKFSHTMPSLAMNQILLLIENCLMCQKLPNVSQNEDLIKKYEKTKTHLENEKQKWEHQEKGTSHKKQSGRFEDHQQPPDDFRQLPIMPTAVELSDPEKPFLRRNIVQGKYSDVNHYLDVQFRLLREDFVRPLRNGIQEFKSNENSHNMDLYIYKDVRITGADVKNFNLIHTIKLSLPKNFKPENSKRLLYGNLVCFSSDKFKTILFGSIAERNPEMLRNGLIGIKFDSDISDTKGGVFIMAESRSYFTAYKHVLKALQEITEENFPMEEFIVKVSKHSIFPVYIDHRAYYDLQVIRNKSMMKTSEMYNALFPQRERPIPDNVVWPTLQRVPITEDIAYWPSCRDLNLDESQRRALRSALTRKLCIIQGPPGTGKTFLGLKIAQVLLHNSIHWKDDDNKSPILVVCFTNHALDQFLEGMTPYTNSIVRVGSRTKSSVIEDFQVNNLVKTLRSRREMPIEIHQTNAEIITQLKNLEMEVKSGRQQLHKLREPEGILSFQFLIHQGVVLDKAAQYFRHSQVDLSQYLLDIKFHYIVKNKASYTRESQKEVRNYAGNDELVDVWYDAEELYAEEEDARKLDEEDFTDAWGHSNIQIQGVTYDKALSTMRKHIQGLRELRTTANVTTVLNIDRKLNEALKMQELLIYGLSIPLNIREAEKYEKGNLEKLEFEQRWMLYKLWLERLATRDADLLETLEQNFERHANAFKEIKDQQYLYVMKHASVVGMTTTGAAQYSSVLQALQPSIVIIEEAAEILEAHVVTSLTEACQHLIMIGDHQQLQPSATVYELATKFGLETSLFERLIKNDVAYETLEYQHRMREDISRLLVPSIYSNLKDHESVKTYPHVKGMQRDVFFITHNYHETKTSDDNSSKENPHEAQLIMALCRHLMLQGYKPDDITVLTPYTGQFFLLKKLQRKYEECQGVRISVVDNFQGEESNIILLSLVRSNEDGNVGFLKKDNRVCVALSRAKHGLYITGNMKQLVESSGLWKKIYEELLANESIGKSIVLQCENHPDVLSSASTGEDIRSKSPEGGCRRQCPFSLPSCGHMCPKVCHMTDIAHVKVLCPQPCPKSICERNHPCPYKCSDVCRPCVVRVPKILPCGHKHKLQCCDYNKDFNCTTLVKRILPACQHEAEMECYKDINTFPCPVPCKIRPPCGHMCTKRCHVTVDPDHLEYQCEQPCARSPDGCFEGHKCKRACYEECGPCIIKIEKKAECGHPHRVHCSLPKNKIVCNEKCKRILPCGHHCRRRCREPCGGCTVKVKRRIEECQHEIEIECEKPATRFACPNPCKMKLPCGHKCKAACRDPCTIMCDERMPSANTCPKGHSINIPCFLNGKVSGEASWTYCSQPCGKMLECEHYCKGKCGSCLHGRLHIACNEKCQRPLVCGHICKADCSSVCPPCQEKCPMRCEHSYCAKKCGDPCSQCQERCPRSCKHTKCDNKCWEECEYDVCEQPCTKKLKCRHPCVGFCGDPCPPLCRICNKDELTEIFFGSEDEDDARFVLLEECGHTFEADGLKGWLSQESEEIGVKACPRCKRPIYNNRRNHEFLSDTYKNVKKVNEKYYSKNPKQQVEEIERLLADTASLSSFGREVAHIRKAIPKVSKRSVRQIYSVISDNEIALYKFQVQVLMEIDFLLKDNHEYHIKLNSYLDFVKSRVMEQKLRIAPQMMTEITCELQRASILPAYWKFLQKADTYRREELMKIRNNLQQLMDPQIKFDSKQEEKVKQQLRESEKYVGGLGITDKERIEILQAMGLKQGHWYKCPNGHIYCITECGGAMEEAKCPECGQKIGGGSHTLRSDNAVASEMDGSQFAAWSNHYNNMGNFQFDF